MTWGRLGAALAAHKILTGIGAFSLSANLG
jgi:hypothetical protein